MENKINENDEERRIINPMEEAARTLLKLTQDEQFLKQYEEWEERKRRNHEMRMKYIQLRKEADEAKQKASQYRQQLIEAGITPND